MLNVFRRLNGLLCIVNPHGKMFRYIKVNVPNSVRVPFYRPLGLISPLERPDGLKIETRYLLKVQ